MNWPNGLTFGQVQKPGELSARLHQIIQRISVERGEEGVRRVTHRASKHTALLYTAVSRVFL